MSVASLPVAVAVARRTWRQTLRRPVTLTFSLVQPLLWMTFFGFLFHRYPIAAAAGDLDYLDFLAPGVCAMTVLFGASQSGIGWIRDLHTGFLQRMLQSPASPAALLAGKVAADIVRLLAQAVAVLLLALALGADITPQRSSPAGLLALILFAAGFSSLSCAIALRTRAQEAMATFVHVVNMPMLFTSSALVPTRHMPDWLATLAAWNPLTLTVDTLRAALLPGFTFTWLPIGILAGLAALLFAWAAKEMGRLARG